MSQVRLDAAFRKELMNRLADFGFRECEPLCFIDEQPDCIKVLNVGCERSTNGYSITLFVGIRFPQVEAVYRPKVTDPSNPTITCPIHFLHDEREYCEWELSVATEISTVVDSIISEFHQFASPNFFDKVATPSALEEQLSSEQPSNWFALGPMQRIGLRAALAIYGKRPGDAELVFEEALADPSNSAPAKAARIKRMRKEMINI